eukprot:GHVS01094652.1.p1 GENE.GHVS01094652.1~~GHVS01094652.1.p1  ORF type:complete len:780 (-),score=244.73 GHVS01094652.1:295-2634(-)
MSYVGYKDRIHLPDPSVPTAWLTNGTPRREQFFRTKFCPWYLAGKCVRGDFCNFAHKGEEVRELPDLQRTKMCSKFTLGAGGCVDPECAFAHSQEQLRHTDVYFKTKLCVNWGKQCCRRGMSCRMAHGMEELRYRSSTPQNNHSYSHLPSTDGTPDTKEESKTTTHARGSLMKWAKAHKKSGTTTAQQQQKQQPREPPAEQQQPLQQQRQAPLQQPQLQQQPLQQRQAPHQQPQLQQQPLQQPQLQQQPLQQQRQAPQQQPQRQPQSHDAADDVVVDRVVSSCDVAFGGCNVVSNDAITGASRRSAEQCVCCCCCAAIVGQHNNSCCCHLNKSIAKNNNIPLVDKQTQLDDENAGVSDGKYYCPPVRLDIGHQQHRHHGRRRSSQATTSASSSGLPDVVVEETADIDEQSSVDDMFVTSDAECVGYHDNTTLATTIRLDGDKLDFMTHDGGGGGWTNRTMLLEEVCDNYKEYDETGGCHVCRLSPPEVVLGYRKQQQQQERTTRWNMLISALEDEDRYCNEQGILLSDSRLQPRVKDFILNKQQSTTVVEQQQSQPAQPATTNHYNNSNNNTNNNTNIKDNEQLSCGDDNFSEICEHNIRETCKQQDSTPSSSIDDDTLLSAQPVFCSIPHTITTTALNDHKICTTTNTLLHKSKTPTTTTTTIGDCCRDIQHNIIPASSQQHICTHYGGGGNSSSCCFAPFCFECYRRGKGGYGIGYYAAVGCLVRQNGREQQRDEREQQTSVCQCCGLPEWLTSCLASQHSDLGCAPLHKLPEAYED